MFKIVMDVLNCTNKLMAMALKYKQQWISLGR
jgi:hypothetical protein